MTRRFFLIFLFAAVLPGVITGASAPRSELRIRADKLVYLERGEIAEFRTNVVFERDDFKGRSRYLKLD